MYERFTDRARKVMQLANCEAQRFRHESVDTPHLLLGLLKEGNGVAANVLNNLGIDLRKARLEVGEIVDTSDRDADFGTLPQARPLKKAVEHSFDAARELNHNYIGTEHLLLGLLREADDPATRVLLRLGLKPADVQQEVLDILGHGRF